MEKIYEIDFAALSDEKKVEFMHHFSDIAEKSFANLAFEDAVNAQLFIFTRWYHSYRLMVPENATPQILEVIIQKLWDYQEGKLAQPEFVHFSRCLDAAVLEIVVGDTEQLEENEAYYHFHAENFKDWDDYYDEFIVDLSYLCYGIREHEMHWINVESILDGDIADIKIPLFEGIDDVSSEAKMAGKQREQKIYSTSRFIQVIALLQEDMRAALSGRSMAELREVYQKKYLFSPEDCAKVTSDWC